MIGKPRYGWCDIKIGDRVLGSASYLTDVPFQVLDAMIQYLSCDNQLPFGLTFDAEGYEFGITQIGETLYLFDTQTNDLIPRLWELDPSLLNKELGYNPENIVKCLAKEAIEDIEDNFDSFLYWLDSKEEMAKSEEVCRKMELKNKIQKVKNILRKDK